VASAPKKRVKDPRNRRIIDVASPEGRRKHGFPPVTDSRSKPYQPVHDPVPLGQVKSVGERKLKVKPLPAETHAMIENMTPRQLRAWMKRRDQDLEALGKNSVTRRLNKRP